MRRHPAGPDSSKLPMVGQALHLPVAADPDFAAHLHDVRRYLGALREDVLVIHEPPTGTGTSAQSSAPGLRRQLLVRHETPELRIVIGFVTAIEPVLRPGTSVLHDERRRVLDPRLRV